MSFHLFKFFKTYWYVFVILIIIMGFGIYHIYEADLDLKDLLRRFGYPIIVGWTFLEGETIVILAGSLSRKLDLKPELIALSAFCGSFASDQLMFTIGKYKGDAVLSAFPRIGRNIDRAAKLFKKYDIALILGFRFVYGIRNVTPLLLGISKLDYKKFFFLNFIGAAVWAASFTYGGLYLGKTFGKAVHRFGIWAFVVLLALVVIGGVIWFCRNRETVRQYQKIQALRQAPPTLPSSQNDSGEKAAP